MATYQAIFVPNSDLTYTVGAGVAVPQTFGQRTVFALISDTDVHIRFSSSTSTGGIKAATVANWLVPAKSVQEFDLSDYYDSISVFNATGGTANIYILFLSRA